MYPLLLFSLIAPGTGTRRLLMYFHHKTVSANRWKLHDRLLLLLLAKAADFSLLTCSLITRHMEMSGNSGAEALSQDLCYKRSLFVLSLTEEVTSSGKETSNRSKWALLSGFCIQMYRLLFRDNGSPGELP